MAIIVIEGKRLDTDKARRSWSLNFHDGSNLYTGELYCSSRGTWYCYTPSQWGNGHRWELCNPSEAIEMYGRGLSDKSKAEILEAANLETE